jgi:hypothetical protein
MVPAEFLTPYLAANAIGLLALGVAVWRPRIAWWFGVFVFVWAACTNAYVALTQPAAYVEYAALTPSHAYRSFIEGWFSRHVAALVLPIAAGQLLIAILMASRDRFARGLGVAGAMVFLAAIIPLGVGSGFPFSITFGAALLVAHRKYAIRQRDPRRDPRPVKVIRRATTGHPIHRQGSIW